MVYAKGFTPRGLRNDRHGRQLRILRRIFGGVRRFPGILKAEPGTRTVREMALVCGHYFVNWSGE
jgi:hypothetical protein